MSARLHGGPRPFVLVRSEDVSGVSGTGIVAEGVVFSDGTVALRWLSQWPTSVVFHDRGLESVERVHGHDGRTVVRFLDEHADDDAAAAGGPSPLSWDHCAACRGSGVVPSAPGGGVDGNTWCPQCTGTGLVRVEL